MAQTCLQPAFQYYYQQLRGSMKVPLQAFKAAHFFVPAKVQEMEIEATTVDELAVLFY